MRKCPLCKANFFPSEPHGRDYFIRGRDLATDMLATADCAMEYKCPNKACDVTCFGRIALEEHATRCPHRIVVCGIRGTLARHGTHAADCMAEVELSQLEAHRKSEGCVWIRCTVNEECGTVFRPGHAHQTATDCIRHHRERADVAEAQDKRVRYS
jgi:hypothetical protein